MNDIDYGALFGVETSENETPEEAPVQEAAEPADGEGTQGANGQETAEPAEPMEDAGASEEEQTPEERAKFAAARRRAEAERDAGIAKARQEAQAQSQQAIDAFVASCGLTNPYTGLPIKTRTEYEAYAAQRDAEKKNALLKKGGISDAEFAAVVQSLPEVREAKQAKLDAENVVRQAKEREAKQRVDEQIREISALDPSVKELSDLSKMENYPTFYAMVKKGYSLTDAFKLANFDRLQAKQDTVSRQAAMNAARGKGHLTQTTTRGSGAVDVPADVMETYRMFNPTATDAEIRQHYARSLKK